METALKIEFYNITTSDSLNGENVLVAEVHLNPSLRCSNVCHLLLMHTAPLRCRSGPMRVDIPYPVPARSPSPRTVVVPRVQPLSLLFIQAMFWCMQMRP